MSLCTCWIEKKKLSRHLLCTLHMKWRPEILKCTWIQTSFERKNLFSSFFLMEGRNWRKPNLLKNSLAAAIHSLTTQPERSKTDLHLLYLKELYIAEYIFTLLRTAFLPHVSVVFLLSSSPLPVKLTKWTGLGHLSVEASKKEQMRWLCFILQQHRERNI